MRCLDHLNHRNEVGGSPHDKEAPSALLKRRVDLYGLTLSVLICLNYRLRSLGGMHSQKMAVDLQMASDVFCSSGKASLCLLSSFVTSEVSMVNDFYAGSSNTDVLMFTLAHAAHDC